MDTKQVGNTTIYFLAEHAFASHASATNASRYWAASVAEGSVNGRKLSTIYAGTIRGLAEACAALDVTLTAKDGTVDITLWADGRRKVQPIDNVTKRLFWRRWREADDVLYQAEREVNGFDMATM